MSGCGLGAERMDSGGRVKSPIVMNEGHYVLAIQKDETFSPASGETLRVLAKAVAAKSEFG
jgi:hypothetical protein